MDTYIYITSNREGHTYCRDIARYLNIALSKAHYYLKKLLDLGLIEIDCREGKERVAIFYRLSYEGDRKAYRKLLIAWLCKKHYLIVLDDLNSIRVGRPKEISMRRVFEFIESRRKFSTRDFCENFGVSYPTAQVYLRILAKA